MRGAGVTIRRILAFGLTLAVGVSIGIGFGRVSAQQAGIKRTVLLRTADPGATTHEVVMGAAELAPGGSAGKHYHHGLEIGYALEGTTVLEIQGKPALTLKPGDSYQIDASAPHDAKNQGTAPSKLVAVYIVEKGKPLAENVQ